MLKINKVLESEVTRYELEINCKTNADTTLLRRGIDPDETRSVWASFFLLLALSEHKVARNNPQRSPTAWQIAEVDN
jgi:hypothetical protein